MGNTITKPVLYNGYQLEDGCEVVRRVAYEFFCDIYELSNDDKLCVFTQIPPRDIKNRKIKFFTIDVEGREYAAIIMDNYSKSRLSNIIKGLTEPFGFDAVAGMTELKNRLKRDIIGPLQNPERYQEFKVSLPNGLLLYGPPGCGKTFIIRKLAEELGYTYVEVKHSDIASTYVHGTVSKVGRLFETAKAKAPTIMFIDEIDGLIPKRENLSSGTDFKHEEINEFLMQLNDAGKQNILVVAATNRPEKIDDALLRSGRMDVKVYVAPPDFEARKELFKLFFNDRPTQDLNYNRLAELTEGYASADIDYIADEAAREALVNGLDYIIQPVVEDVIAETQSSISAVDLMTYERFGKQ